MSGGLFSSDQLAQFRGLNQKHLWIKAPLSVKNLTFINHDEKNITHLDEITNVDEVFCSSMIGQSRVFGETSNFATQKATKITHFSCLTKEIRDAMGFLMEYREPSGGGCRDHPFSNHWLWVTIVNFASLWLIICSDP